MNTKVQVAIRVKPCSQPHELVVEANTIGSRQNNQILYTFDRIFDENTSTISIYNSFCKNLISSACQGINGTIFAYGQTSSGKTFTMQGTDEEPGIINHAIRNIFKHIVQTPEREFLLRCSYLEIYNESIKDLLTPGKDNLKIHEHFNKGIFINDLSEVVVCSALECEQLLQKGEKNRHVGETNMNERSSRSHTIFKMVIESRERDESCSSSRNSYSGAVLVSCINLVDLAGSERIGHTGSEGLRLKEGTHINKSLLALGSVIAKLSEGGAHIPYRDSKLTRILQPSLGGNANTAIICTITPEGYFLDESVGTLKFANRAKTIQNSPEVNETYLSDEALLKKYRLEISGLKNQLDQIKQPKEVQSEESKAENQRMFDHIEELKRVILSSSNAVQVKQKKKIVRRQTWFAGCGVNNENIDDIPEETPESTPFCTPLKNIIPVNPTDNVLQESIKDLPLVNSPKNPLATASEGVDVDLQYSVMKSLLKLFEDRDFLNVEKETINYQEQHYALLSESYCHTINDVSKSLASSHEHFDLLMEKYQEGNSNDHLPINKEIKMLREKLKDSQQNGLTIADNMVQMEKENENNAKEILLLNNEIRILKEKLGKADTHDLAVKEKFLQLEREREESLHIHELELQKVYKQLEKSEEKVTDLNLKFKKEQKLVELISKELSELKERNSSFDNALEEQAIKSSNDRDTIAKLKIQLDKSISESKSKLEQYEKQEEVLNIYSNIIHGALGSGAHCDNIMNDAEKAVHLSRQFQQKQEEQEKRLSEINEKLLSFQAEDRIDETCLIEKIADLECQLKLSQDLSASLEASLQALNIKLTEIEQNAKFKLQAEVSKYTILISDLEEELKKSADDNLAKSREIDLLKVDFEKNVTLLEGCEKSSLKLQEDFTAQIIALNKDCDSLRCELAIDHEKSDSIYQKLKEVTFQYDQLKMAFDKSSEKLAIYVDDIQRSNNIIEELENGLQSVEDEKNRVLQRNEMLRKQQAEFESKLCQAEKKRKELEDTSKCLELEKALLKKEIQDLDELHNANKNIEVMHELKFSMDAISELKHQVSISELGEKDALKKIGILNEEIDQIKSREYAWMKKYEMKSNECDELQSSMKQRLKQLDLLKMENEHLVTENAAYISQSKKYQQEEYRLHLLTAENKHQNEISKKTLEEITSQANQYKKSIMEKKSKIKQLVSHCEQLQQKNDLQAAKLHESETKVADLLAGKVAILKDEGTEAGKPVLNIEMIKQNLLSIFELLGGLMNLDFDEEIKNLISSDSISFESVLPSIFSKISATKCQINPTVLMSELNDLKKDRENWLLMKKLGESELARYKQTIQQLREDLKNARNKQTAIQSSTAPEQLKFNKENSVSAIGKQRSKGVVKGGSNNQECKQQ